MPENRPHILVVDDSADQADSLAELLEMWGYEVATRYDGPAALVAAGCRRPAVVLVDIGMPGMDGFEFVALFRDLPGCGTTTVVAVSGYETLASRAAEAGIDHYLVKPVEPRFLRAFVLRVVNTPAPRTTVSPRRPTNGRHTDLCVTG